MIQVAEQNNNTDEVKLEYDDKNPFVVCGLSLRPIYRGTEQARCAFCYQPYLPKHKGETCLVCTVGRVVGDATGMVNSYEQLK